MTPRTSTPEHSRPVLADQALPPPGPGADRAAAGSAPAGSSVGVVVDDSVAALGAARWAAALARQAGQDLVAIVLLPAGADGRAVLGRAEPTLRSAGRLTVVSCAVPTTGSLRQLSLQAAEAVRRCLTPHRVALLVLPADPRLADPRRRRHSLVAHLVADPAHDLLLVPGLGGAPARSTGAGRV